MTAEAPLEAYIVWNEPKNEGVVFVGDEGKADALHCVRRDHHGVCSALGHDFSEEMYEDDDLTLETIDLAKARAAPEMYEALGNASSALCSLRKNYEEESGLWGDVGRFIAEANAALSKARGAA